VQLLVTGLNNWPSVILSRISFMFARTITKEFLLRQRKLHSFLKDQDTVKDKTIGATQLSF